MIPALPPAVHRRAHLARPAASAGAALRLCRAVCPMEEERGAAFPARPKAGAWARPPRGETSLLAARLLAVVQGGPELWEPPWPARVWTKAEAPALVLLPVALAALPGQALRVPMAPMPAPPQDAPQESAAGLREVLAEQQAPQLWLRWPARSELLAAALPA